MNVLITARARAEAAALSGAEYVEICTVVAALRKTGRLPGGRFGIVNDQFDLYACETPGTDQMMIFAHDPATPQTAALALLWPGRDFTSRAKATVAGLAGSALGLLNPRTFVF